MTQQEFKERIYNANTKDRDWFDKILESMPNSFAKGYIVRVSEDLLEDYSSTDFEFYDPRTSA